MRPLVKQSRIDTDIWTEYKRGMDAFRECSSRVTFGPAHSGLLEYYHSWKEASML